MSALAFVKRRDDEPFRLIIETSGAHKTSKATTGNSLGYIHRNVCDGCKAVVKGFRYKCLQCPDFDLCGQCETAGMHPHHNMFRVAGPMVTPQQLQ